MPTSSPQATLTLTRETGPGPLVSLEGVERTYRLGRVDYRALRGIDVAIDRGEIVAIEGPSGSGKSTILNMITGIDHPSSGHVIIDGHNLNAMSEDELAKWRGIHVGIVFQFFQLLPTLTALENTILPMEFARLSHPRERATTGMAKLTLVGLDDKADRFPSELSGGEQQRVAIARALACNPLLLIADEPTGNLDSETAQAMLEVLASVNSLGTTVIFVTHDHQLASQADRIITIRDGKVVEAAT